jgi:hypothetical protein
MITPWDATPPNKHRPTYSRPIRSEMLPRRHQNQVPLRRQPIHPHDDKWISISAHDRWSGECHSRRLQGGRNAITDCPTFQSIPIECAEGVGIGRTKAVKSRREPSRLKSPNGAHFQMKNRPARDGSQTTATEIGVPAGGFRREFLCIAGRWLARLLYPTPCRPFAIETVRGQELTLSW